MSHLLIIGNGISGITVARHVRKMSDRKITVISGETDHFFSRTALMYIYMGHMKYEHTKPYEDWFWQKNKIELVRGWVQKIDPAEKIVALSDGRQIPYDKLVIATGSKSNKFGWPGQDLPGVQGLYSYQDLELLEENSKNVDRAVIVGGGLIGIELAEMLLSRQIPVTFLVREQFYWDNILPQPEAKMITRHIRHHGVDLRLETNLKEIIAGENERVAAVITESGEKIDCQLVGLTPGVHPNIELLKDSPIATNRGVLVNDYLETNIPDIYALGDCAEIIVDGAERNRLEQLWYTGKMQGQALAQTICGNRTKYERGLWFNSAKFMDIEYQTYGFVSSRPREGEARFYWEHPDGEHACHFVFDEKSLQLTGVNFFGMRMRHKLFDQWLSEGRSVEYVLENLKSAHFDPEFFSEYEDQIIDAYNAKFQKSIRAASKFNFWGKLVKSA